MKKIKIIGSIVETRHCGTSYYGNPRYEVWFKEFDTDERFYSKTAPNDSIAYAINNNCFRSKPCEITYHVTSGGAIVFDYISEINLEECGIHKYNVSVNYRGTNSFEVYARDKNSAAESAKQRVDYRCNVTHVHVKKA